MACPEASRSDSSSGAGPPGPGPSDLRRDTLELEKLKAEIADLNSQIAARSKAPSRAGWLRDWAGVFIAVLTIAGSAWGLYKGFTAFMTQRQRELVFNVNKEMIDLSVQLASTDPVQRTNAALLLANYEEQAVPILVTSLRVTDRENLPDDITRALALVMDKPRVRENPGLVLRPLMRQAARSFREVLRSPEADITALSHYLEAITELGKRSSDGFLLERLGRLKERALASDTRFSDIQREALREYFDTAMAAVGRADNRVAFRTTPVS